MADKKKNRPYMESSNLSLRKAVKSAYSKHPTISRSSSDTPLVQEKVSAFRDANGNPREFSVTVPMSSNKLEVPDKAELLKNPRYRILKEMKDSERTYLTFLQSVVLLFYSPLKSSTLTATPILSAALIDDLFGNILEVAELSSQILQAVEVLLHPQTWNETKTTLGDFFFELLSVSIPNHFCLKRKLVQMG